MHIPRHSIATAAFVSLLSIAPGYAGINPFSAERGSASYDELKLPRHARSAALAGGGVAKSVSPQELGQTPLALTLAEGYFISATSSFLPKEMGAKYHTLLIGTHTSALNIALGGSYLDYEDIEGRSDTGEPTTLYSAQSFHVQTTVAGDSSRLSWGVQCTYSFQAIDSYASHALSGTGAVSFALTNTFFMAASLYNAGYSTSLNSKSTTLPLTFIFSAARTFAPSALITTTTFIDIKKINEEPLHPIVSQELSFFSIAFLRAGFNMHSDQSWSLGGGVHFEHYAVDYAFQNHPELEGYHHLSLGINF